MHEPSSEPRAKRVVVLHSGGKDSTYSAWWAQMKGWEIVAMASVLIDSDDSMMFQTDSTWVSGHQSRMMGVPWMPILSSGTEEEEVYDLQRGLEEGVESGTVEKWFADREIACPDYISLISESWDGLVVGALRSDYQKTRIERLTSRLNVTLHSPLWRHDPMAHMQSLMSHNFQFVITSVSCEGLGREWLGRVIDQESLSDLVSLSEKYRFNVDGEGGEFETIVTDAPSFAMPLELSGSEQWYGNRGIFRIRSARPIQSYNK